MFSLAFATLLVTSSNAVPDTGGASGRIEWNRAAELAQRAYPGRVIGATLENGVWEVSVIGENRTLREIRLDERTGSVMSQESYGRSTVPQTSVTFSGAANRSSAHAQGRIIEIELEREEGRWVWGVYRQSGGQVTEVTLCAQSGRMIEVERVQR